MAIDLQSTQLNKDKIISIISTKGPSLPVQIAAEVNLSSLLISAFLSELQSEGKIRISHLKVGDSPLYYLAGQEHMLENFTQNLNDKEKEAFELLKKEKILEDEKQLPEISAALRDLKDFALPVKIKLKNKDTPILFWKYFQFPDAELKTMLQGHPDEAIAKMESRVDRDAPIFPPVSEDIPQETPKEKKKPKKLSEEDSKFVNSIKDYLVAKDIEIISSILERKKEFMAKVRIDTLFGKQEYYLVAKDKKRIGLADLDYLHQGAQLEKMPALLISQGELDKKANAHLKEFRNLIKFEKIKF